MVKIAVLTIPIYRIARFLHTRDRAYAARFDARTVRLSAVVLAFQLAMNAVQLFLLARSGTAMVAGLIGGQVVGALLLAWAVAAPLGNAAIGPRASIAIMARQVPWTIVFTLAVMLPLMVPHYAPGAAALIGPKAALWPVLVVDALLVRWMAPVMIAGGYVAAMLAADRAGVSLAMDDGSAFARA